MARNNNVSKKKVAVNPFVMLFVEQETLVEPTKSTEEMSSQEVTNAIRFYFIKGGVYPTQMQSSSGSKKCFHIRKAA